MTPGKFDGPDALIEEPGRLSKPHPNRQTGKYGTHSGVIVVERSLSQLESQVTTNNDATESSPLLNPILADYNGDDTSIAAVWKHEAKTIVKYSAPTTLTLLLQYSLTTSSVFVIGHLGKRELGAVSLANMTAIITGYAVYQGFATSLDTLCPQAYGSGKFRLVGLHMQRLTLLLLLVTIPIGIIWLQAENILRRILPREDQETAALAGLYLRIILLGAPGYACFESGKRFVQSQGLFHVSLHVLLFCAPLNAFMSWFFVWKLQWGFIGAPIAVAIINNLLPLLLALYIYLFTNSSSSSSFTSSATSSTSPSCWHPLSTTHLLQNWSPMLRLAIPGLLNIEAEFLAWEILTLVSSYLGSTPLAAQSALYSVACNAYQISFSAAVGSSTRIAMLIGAGDIRRGVIAAKVALVLALCFGLCNISLLVALRTRIPDLYTADPEVKSLMAALLPLVALLQIFDAMACSCNGILRAVGRPAIGSYVQLGFYYGLSLPVGLWLAFRLDGGVMGIWIGMVLGLFGITVVELWIILRIDWTRAVKEAEKRNMAET